MVVLFVVLFGGAMLVRRGMLLGIGRMRGRRRFSFLGRAGVLPSWRRAMLHVRRCHSMRPVDPIRTFVADHVMHAPIGMNPFPAMKPAQDDIITSNPIAVRSKIIKSPVHLAHIFISIPNIGHRNDLHRRSSHVHMPLHHHRSGGPDINRTTRRHRQQRSKQN